MREQYPDPTYSFRCRFDRVVDADTWEIVMDLGFDSRRKETVRAAGIDTHEIHFAVDGSTEHRQGMKQMQFVQSWVDENRSDDEFPFVLHSEKYSRGKYGRVIGDIYPADGGEGLTTALAEQFVDVKASGD